jgi:nicotinate-nucleotide--dimethylbenzimidazole phosphoribosyltransferase
VRSGGAAVGALARNADATVRVLDLSVDADTPADVAVHKIRRSSGRIDREDALSLADAERAFAVGVAVVDEEVDGGADLLVPGDLGVGGTTVAAVLIAALTDTEPIKAIGRGSGIDDRAWMRKVVVIRDALRRARPFAGDPLALLAVAGGADVAAMTGFLLQAAVRRTPVLLDGVLSAAAALVATAVTPSATAWWLAAHRSAEPAHATALAHLDLPPVLDLGIRAGEGTGALAVLPLLRAAVRSCAETATADAAGLHRLGSATS